MKGFIRIGGAVFIGVVVILGAFYVNNSKETKTQKGHVIVVTAEPRKAIETRDENGDGVADWKTSFDTATFETIKTPEPTADTDNDEEEYVPPDTLTGKFSVAFFKDYLDGKKSGQSFENPEAFVGNAVTAIERSTESKRHTRLELNIIETSGETLYEYGNELVKIFLSYPLEEKSDGEILQRALQNNDKEILNELVPIRDAYASVLFDILNMEVPSELAQKHIELVNGYEKLYTNLDAMLYTFDDPLYALARIRNHPNDMTSLAATIRSVVEILTKNGVVYTNDELGAYLYIFDI